MAKLDFSSAREQFRSGTLTPRKFLETCLKQIEKREPTVRAFVTLNLEGARRAADASDKRWKSRKPLSSIDGLPIAIKDIIETEDMPTEFGSKVFKGWNGRRDSACAYALRQAGAIIVGKAVTTEFAGAPPGPTTNPHDPKRTPGGSSSGSAAAVAAGMVPVAIGTQVGGSVLRPASFCGVVGFKPTFGALNRGGIGDQFSQNCIGTLSHTLEDAWAVAHEIAIRVGGDPGFPPFAGGAVPAAPRRPDVLAVLETDGWAVADAAAKKALEAFLKKVRAAGVTLIDRRSSKRVAQLEGAIAGASDLSLGINDWEKLWPFAELDLREGKGLSEGLRKAIANGRKMTPDDYVTLLKRRDFAREVLLSLAGDVDACITLGSAGPAPLGIGSTGNAVFNMPASMLRNPALSLPLLRADGLPLGLQLLGFPGQERALSGIAGYVQGLGGKKAS
jgi:Asp-tRNA(Asn)/Glu-tRNA(Gln) amidotransferase A subunit family amidase